MTGITVVCGHSVTSVTVAGSGDISAFHANPSFRRGQYASGEQRLSRAQHSRSIQVQIFGDLVPGEEGRVTIPTQSSSNHPQNDP